MRATDRREMERLYRDHSGAAFGLAMFLTQDRSLAEDIVHDAFLRAYDRVDDLHDRQAFGAYLRRSVSNAVASHGRHRNVVVRFVRRGPDPSFPSAADPGDVVPHQQFLRDALAQLPARQRLAVVARFWLDLSEGETVDLLDCPRGTAKSLVSRGLAQLRLLTGASDDRALEA